MQVAGALRGKQVPLLFAYLVLHRSRTVGREELIGALWPAQAPRSQDAALRTLLSRLRSALGRDSLSGREELALELAEPVWIDLEAAGVQLERATERLAAGDARGAWALAQVPLNIAARGLLPASQAEWLEPRRRELEDLRLRALEVVGRAGLELGGTQLGSAERASRALIAAEPYRESGHVLLMRALAARGDTAEALLAFERLRQRLRDELGTAPAPETIAAHEELLLPSTRSGAPRAAEPADRGGLELPPELRHGAEAPLVGRTSELAELQRHWAGVAGTPGDSGAAGEGGGPRIVLIAGDAGIGKTRLLTKIAGSAHAEGAVVLAGRAPEEALVPYQPCLEALRHYVRGAPLPELRAATREYGSELARLVPELRRRVPDLPLPPDEPTTERYRLFEAVVGLLGEISARAPVLIVLDDLHWADRPTLLLLRHLARAPAAARVLVLGAYRAGERWSEAFVAAMADLRRERLAAQLELRGLEREETAELVLVRSGRRPSEPFARALHADTEGNPLFVEEIVRHLGDAGVDLQDAGAGVLRRFGLPDEVKDVISRRLARLEDSTAEWLRVAAVIGRDFELALLERILPFDEDRFLAALEEALAEGLVLESPADAGRYGFSHALIREALYEGMSRARLARIHRRVGQALEEDGDERHVSALAHHFTRTADVADTDRAIRYARSAGEQASAMLAHEEAADHYARALEVLDRGRPGSTRERCELLLLLGEAQMRSGERPLASQTFREAATLAAELGDGSGLARAAVGASRRYVQPPGVVDEELIDLLERALGMISQERSVRRIEVIARLCGALYFSPRRDQMTALSAEASEIARELGDPVGLALAASARRRANWDREHLSERLSDATAMLHHATEAGDVELVLQAHAWLVVDLLEQGDHAAVKAQMRAFQEGAERLRQPLFTWNAAVWEAMRALLEGRLDDADRLAGAAVAAGAQPENATAGQYYAAQLLAIRREQCRMAELESAARALVAENPHRPAWRAALGTLLYETGRPELAREEFERLAAEEFEDVPRDGDWMITIVLLAELCAELGDAERARRLYRMLGPYADGNVVIGLAAVCHGAAGRYLGVLALAFGDGELARGHLERAIELNTAMGAHVHLAHSRIDHARALGRSEGAERSLAAAEAAARELDLPRVKARARALRGAQPASV